MCGSTETPDGEPCIKAAGIRTNGAEADARVPRLVRGMLGLVRGVLRGVRVALRLYEER